MWIVRSNSLGFTTFKRCTQQLKLDVVHIPYRTAKIDTHKIFISLYYLIHDNKSQYHKKKIAGRRVRSPQSRDIKSTLIIFISLLMLLYYLYCVWVVVTLIYSFRKHFNMDFYIIVVFMHKLNWFKLEKIFWFLIFWGVYFCMLKRFTFGYGTT